MDEIKEDNTKDYKDFIKGIRYNDELERLELSKRTFNCLVCIGDIEYISQLIEMSENDLLDILFVGKKTVEEIKEKLAKHNLRLKENKTVQKKITRGKNRRKN